MALDFPASSASPFTAPNGVIYTWNADGYWEAKADPNDFDSDYLKLNATNGPVTGNLALNQDLSVGDDLTVGEDLTVTGTSAFTGVTTHEGGVNVTGGDLSVSGDVAIQGSGSTTKALLVFQKDITNVNNAISVVGTLSYNQNATTVHTFLSNPKLSITGGGNYVGYLASIQDFSGVTGINTGFRAENGLQAASGVGGIGFSSHLDTKAGKDNYNFYAAGDAPNYFNGEIRCGGDSTDPLNNQKTGFAGIVNNTSGRKSVYVHSGSLNIGANADPSTSGLNIVDSNLTGIQMSGDTARFSRNTTQASDVIMSINRGGGGVGGDANPLPAISFHINGTKYASIDISSSGAAFNNTSDYRAKTNIRDYTGASSVIQSLNVKQYTLFDEPDVVGFIAHELQEVLPKAVRGDKDGTEAIGTLADYDGTVLETAVVEPPAEELEYTEEVETDGVATMVTRTRTWTPSGTRPVYQGVDQTKLIPLLTKALQEALDRIEVLEAAAT